MAVYTKVSDSEIADLLQDYNIGSVKELKAIEQGVENSNYFLTTDKAKYVLTIYEKRVNESELPYYIGLMQHLAKKGFPCPLPVTNKKGDALSKIQGRPCAIVTFLHGKGTNTIRNSHLEELGRNVARMHLAASDFPLKRKNDLSVHCWEELFYKIKDQADGLKKGLATEVASNLETLSANWPSSLYSGVIHADLFPDNVFFTGDKFAGVIDFYFACNDFLMYDIAICLNAWCFENNNEFNVTKARKLLSSYNKVRPISEEELDALPTLASGAALRFLLTRLYDWFNTDETALVKPKNPLEYLERLRFHNGIKYHTEYGL